MHLVDGDTFGGVFLAHGGGRGGTPQSPSWDGFLIAALFTALWGIAASTLFRAARLSVDERPRWGRRGRAGPISAFGCYSLGATLGLFAIASALSGVGLYPPQIIPLMVVSVAVTFAAALHDSWAASDYRIW